MPASKAPDRNAKGKKKSAPSMSMKPSRPAPPPTSFKSAEYVQESDNDEPANSEKGDESKSDEESLRSSPADVMITSNGKLQRPAGSSSSSENESESDENGSEVSNKEEEDLVVASKEKFMAPVNKSTKPSIATFQKPSPYKPPVGFEKEEVDATPKFAQMFKKSSLEGKQIWYFTAPASLPISSIGQVSLRDARTSKAIVSHKGNEYGFIQDSAEDKTYTKIMVPHGSDGYRIAVKPIDHVLHIQQIVKLPGIHDSSSMTTSLSNTTARAKKPVRQQPPGLKMRFRPIGFGDGEPGRIGSSSSSVEGNSSSDSGERMEESPVVFRRPVPLTSENSDESSESSESEGSSDVEMTEAQPLPTTKGGIDETSATSSTSQEMTNGSLKRKHGGEGRKSKHSSFRSSNIDDRELKRLKTKHNESQKRLENGTSVSIEPHKSSKLRLPANPAISPTKEITPIRPSKTAVVRHSSPVPQVQVNHKKDEKRFFEKSKYKKRDRSKPATLVQKSEGPLPGLTTPTDPSLTGEGRRKKIKKLKSKE